MAQESITFSSTETFGALRKAEASLIRHGFSFGSWQRGSPCGVMLGDYDISKWRNLSAREREQLDAVILGDGRNGPIDLRLNESATKEAVAAFHQMMTVHTPRAPA